jgi:hypothetical protein
VTGLSRPGDPVPTQVAPDALEALRTDLARLDDLRDRLGTTTLTPPPPGSRAAKDLPEPERAYAHYQASGSISAALDHLTAWRELLLNAGIMPMYAHMSLLRTAHEAALLAEWLMDPAIDDDVRRARGVAVQLEDFKERRKFEDSAGGPRVPLQGKSAAQRIDDLMAAANRLGLTKKNPKGDDVLTTTVPSTVDLFDLYETDGPMRKGQMIYRLESAYAHAKQWALLMGAEQAVPSDGSGRTIVQVGPSEKLAATLTRRCVNAVERGLNAKEALRQPPPPPHPDGGQRSNVRGCSIPALIPLAMIR